jgi:hypothetical protein
MTKDNGDSKFLVFSEVMRMMTPIFLGITITLVSYILDDLKDVKRKLDNHLTHTMVDVNNRLSSLEQKQSEALNILNGLKFKVQETVNRK